MSKFVLHILPDSVENTKKLYVGTTKDLRGRTEYFQTRGIEFRELISEDRSDSYTLAQLKAYDFSNCVAVFFEGETYIKSLGYLKETYPHIRRVVRSYNANLPHFLDNFRGHLTMQKAGEAVDDVHMCLERYLQDIQCAELADYMLAISEWEYLHYWGEMVDRSKVVFQPYFLPKMYEEKIPTVERINLCVCFMGTAGVMTPFLFDAGNNTTRLVRNMKWNMPEWSFKLTGRLQPIDQFGVLGRMKHVGRIPDPFELLASAKVMTILSNYGFGFKTKILEALMAGCWVFLTQEVYDRIPAILRPGCKVIDLEVQESFEQGLRDSMEPPPQIDYNSALREQAFAALDQMMKPRL